MKTVLYNMFANFEKFWGFKTLTLDLNTVLP